MSSLFRSPEETALMSLGIAIEAAATFYDHAREISDETLQPFLRGRADALSQASKRWNECLTQNDILPGKPDEDAESLRHLALLAGTTLGSDEAAVVFDMCARTEHRLLTALGDVAPTVPPSSFIGEAQTVGNDCLSAIAEIWRLRAR